MHFLSLLTMQFLHRQFRCKTSKKIFQEKSCQINLLMSKKTSFYVNVWSRIFLLFLRLECILIKVSERGFDATNVGRVWAKIIKLLLQLSCLSSFHVKKNYSNVKFRNQWWAQMHLLAFEVFVQTLYYTSQSLIENSFS